MLLLSFFPNFIIFFYHFIIFYQIKHIFSFIKISSICITFLKRIYICIKAYFFSIFIANKIFKILFTERDLIRYNYFIKIYIVYQNRAFMLVKFVFSCRYHQTLYFFIHFYIWFYDFFYNFLICNLLLFLFKSVF